MLLSISQRRDCHNIVMKRRQLLCLPVWNQAADNLGANLISLPGVPWRNVGTRIQFASNNYHNNDERHISDICFIPFKDERCQALWLACCDFSSLPADVQRTILGIFIFRYFRQTGFLTFRRKCSRTLWLCVTHCTH